MADEPGARIARQDEVLQLLYWLEGEGFGADATLAGIVRFIAQSEPEVRDALDQLVRRGDITVDEAGRRYRLTGVGSGEAGRRFAEEFAPLLQPGHGECADPTCDCHTNPAAATECRAVRAGGGDAGR